MKELPSYDIDLFKSLSDSDKYNLRVFKSVGDANDTSFGTIFCESVVGIIHFRLEGTYGCQR